MDPLARTHALKPYQNQLSAHGYTVAMQPDGTLTVQDPVWISNGLGRRVEYETVILKDSTQAIRFLMARGH